MIPVPLLCNPSWADPTKHRTQWASSTSLFIAQCLFNKTNLQRHCFPPLTPTKTILLPSHSLQLFFLHFFQDSPLRHPHDIVVQHLIALVQQLHNNNNQNKAMSTTMTNMQTCGYDPNGIAVNDYLQRTYDVDPKKRKQVLSELCPCKTMVKKPLASSHQPHLKDLKMTFVAVSGLVFIGGL